MLFCRRPFLSPGRLDWLHLLTELVGIELFDKYKPEVSGVQAFELGKQFNYYWVLYFKYNRRLNDHSVVLLDGPFFLLLEDLVLGCSL